MAPRRSRKNPSLEELQRELTALGDAGELGGLAARLAELQAEIERDTRQSVWEKVTREIEHDDAD